MNRHDLERKLSTIATVLLREKGHITFVDVFMKLGYLDSHDYESWRMRRVPFLEKAIKVNLGTINFIMKNVRRNSRDGHLKESWTAYRSWGKGPKQCLRFSKSGNESIEKAYATHFLKKRLDPPKERGKENGGDRSSGPAKE